MNAAGMEVKNECSSFVAKYGQLAAGDTVVTKGGNL
jgi:hypothetical protein